MPIPVSSSFKVSAQVPMEERTIQADLTARDAIPTIERFDGLRVYVVSEQKNYQLVGGIANGDWEEVSIIGTNGTSARGVSLTSTGQVFSYNSAGLIPAPATTTVVANVTNTVGTVWYDFLLNGVSVQNSIVASYTYTPQASFLNMPETVGVNIRESNGTNPILASATMSMVGLKAGSNGITILLSNSTHALPADETGAVTSYVNSGTDISAWIGTQRLTVDQNNPYGTNTFRVSAAGTHITPGAASGVDGAYIRTYGVHSAMSGVEPGATIAYTVTVKDDASVETILVVQQTFTKAIAGADGTDGSGGSDSRAVALTSTKQGFVYNTAGNYNDVATATVTATAVNTTGVVWYEFFVEDVSKQNSIVNTYTYTPPALYSSMPDKVEVHIREDSSIGTIVARDQMTMVGLKAGTHGDTIALSNEAHTLPTTPAGVVTYTGSGTKIYAWHGATQLTYDASGAPAINTFRVTSAVGTDITVGTPSTVAPYTRVYGDHTNMIADTASIEYTIIVKDEAAQEITFYRTQSFAKSKAGAHSSSVNLTNSGAVLPASSSGVVSSYAGSGVDITAWHGTTQLTYDDSGSPAVMTFKVSSAVTDGTIIIGSASTVGSIRRFAPHSGMALDTATITYTITIKDEAGADKVFVKVQNFSKAKEGALGAPGATGPYLYFAGEYSALGVYYNSATRRDIVKYGSLFYLCAANPSPSTPESWNAAHWEAFSGNYSSIATEVLFASLAYIDNLGIRLGLLGGWNVDSDSIYTGTKVTGDGYSAAPTYMTIKSDGSIHAYKFYINADGTTNFSGVNLSHMIRKKAGTVPINIDPQYVETHDTAGFEKRRTFTLTNGLIGIITVKVDARMSDDGGGGTGEVRIRYNNGTEFSPAIAFAPTLSGIMTTYSGNTTSLSLAPGGTIELWVSASGDYRVYTEYFSLCYLDDPDPTVAAVAS